MPIPFRRLIRWTAPLVVLAVSAVLVGTVGGSQPEAATPAARIAKHKHHVRHRARHHHKKRAARWAAAGGAAAALTVAGLREISYYPSQHPWGGTWSDWDPGVIDQDMAKLAALGANTVRIFVQPLSFGYPTPRPEYIARLRQMLAIAAAHGLSVHITLFDLWHSYADVQGSQQWAGKLLAPFHADPRIACVELQNEIDPGDSRAMAWARAMLPVIHRDADVPVTVSVTDWNSAGALARLVSALGPVKPDFYDLHFYGQPAYMVPTFNAAKQIAAGRPLLIGETGYSTAASSPLSLNSSGSAAQEQQQATYVDDVERAALTAGLPLVGIWSLNDFAPRKGLSSSEQHFGLYRLDGTAKPAAAVLRRYFTAAG